MNYDKSFRRRWLSLFVENQIGVLARISGLLSAKSCKIHSLTVGETQDRAISRMTVCLDADDKTFEQIMKQLNRSIEVIKVIDITDASIRSKEVMFIKIKGINERDRAEVFQMAQAFKFRIKDMDHNSVLVEAVRTEIVNDSILNLINERFKNIEVVRGGPVAIESISMQDR